MPKSKTPKELRTYVEEQAKGYCEYCIAFSQFSPSNFEMEHIQAETKGGQTNAENLALSCRRCNGLKFTKTQLTLSQKKLLICIILEKIIGMTIFIGMKTKH